MSDTNLTVLEGRLTRSAELKYSKNNCAICTFSIANNESVKGPDGNWTNLANFFDCVIYGKYGESMSKHLKKGRGVTVTGKLKQDRWEKDGQKYSRVTVKVQELSLSFDGKSNNQDSSTTETHDTSIDFPPPDEGNPFDESGTAVF